MAQQKLMTEARKRQLVNDDFLESENNRDPFRSFLSTFAAQAPAVTRQHKILLDKFGLDELKLVGIVGGDGISSRAMFTDPNGMGIVIQRGDHLSKSDATVTRIAPDRVVVTIEEDAGGGKTSIHERVIALRAGETVIP